MHSFSWWRMVGRVMECKGGAPLTNEIKIFKHCFMILLGPRTFPVTCLLWAWPPRDMIVVSFLIYNICLCDATCRKCPYATLLQYLSHQLIIPAPIITSRTRRTPVRLTACLPAKLYLFPLFIVTTLIPPLTISSCTHHVTMKDEGFKWPSLQHPPSQLAFSNQ